MLNPNKTTWRVGVSTLTQSFKRFYCNLSTTITQQQQQMNQLHVVDTYQFNFKLKQLLKSGQLMEARHLFDKTPHRDEISWTTLISAYVNSSLFPQAFSLFNTMWLDPSVPMDPFVLSAVLKACGLDFNLTFGESLHAFLVKSGFVNSVFVGSSLLDMYTKFGKLSQACTVFHEMPFCNVVSWTAIITGLVHAGANQKGLFYFSEMGRSNVEYDSYTFAIALKACADSRSFSYGREIHTLTVKKGFDVTSFVANTLATMYNKCGKFGYGLKLFERMSNKDVVSWTAIITSYVQTGRDKHAIDAFLKMRESGVDPNEYTFAAVISGLASLARIEWGEQLHAHVLQIGLLDSLSVANSFMTMYSKCGMLTPASTVFREMKIKDIISWSTIIGAYSQAGYGEESFKFLSLMRKEGPKPNEFALASVLSVCGNMASLEQGKQLHAHALSIGLDQTAMIQSALINMYSKCGSVEEASLIFDMARYDDVVSWTAMINGYAVHGYSQEAISLFEKLCTRNLKPDSVTFIGVLSACSHAGLVDAGFHYFYSMRTKYQIEPEKEHYGCMIDLLCRAGRLSQAETILRSMPFIQEDVVWSTLLRACRAHGDVERGERAADENLKLDPDCEGTHITLANMYAAEGKWGKMADVRKLMKSKGVVKKPGWSSVKVKCRESAFVAGDRMHQESEEIYRVLELLTWRREMAIEESDTYLLYDVDMTKEECGHTATLTITT